MTKRKINKTPREASVTRAMTLKEIGVALGVSHQRVTQIERRAMAKMREAVGDMKLSDVLIRAQTTYNPLLVRVNRVNYEGLYDPFGE